ncbi:MAG: beta-galactosidase [Geminicoccaceae bacterium]
MTGDKPREAGVCYYPEHWPEDIWAEDAARMHEAGIRWVRIGEFAWSRMEPDPGRLDLDWLDRAIDTLGAAGLSVVMCTPTATPPKWLVDRMPDMLAVDGEGRKRGFGSRRHYCFSHEGYVGECRRIARILGERYGRNPHVQAWQIDNEYGCHDTALSYSDAALSGFRLWLRERYRTIRALNEAWGTVFWSMEYRDFDEIELPAGTVTEAHPAHCLDFRRYSSDRIVHFNRAQAEILRETSPGRRIIHNFMGRTLSFDHFAVGADLDVAAWDAYPLGFLERDGSGERQAAFERQGDPDFQAFHHDLYRACSPSMWIMELQPGPVNWAPFNPAPLPGMVRLWGMEAAAHGADVVSYFRWRQAPFAQEQMHTGLLRPDSAAAPGLAEAAQVASDLRAIGPFALAEAPVAILFDYESAWGWEIQPQGRGLHYFDLVYEAYRALRRQGLSVDILSSASRDWGKRKLVLVPGLLTWTDAAREALRTFEGEVLVGPRTGSRTVDFQIPERLGPDLDPSLLDLRVALVESLRPGSTVRIGNHGSFRSWSETLEPGDGAEILWQTSAGKPALARQQNLHYLAGWPDEALWDSLVSHFADRCGLETRLLPDGLRLRETTAGLFAFNYSTRPVDLASLGLEGFDALDGNNLAPAGVALKPRP